MAIKARDYIARLTPAKQEVIQQFAEEMIAEEMNLAQLRAALKRSQAEVAAKCGVKQAAISRLERRTDMRIGTLRNLVGAMGGTLCITALFPNRDPVRISQFARSDLVAVDKPDEMSLRNERPKRSQISGSAKKSSAKTGAPAGKKRNRPRHSGG